MGLIAGVVQCCAHGACTLELQMWYTIVIKFYCNAADKIQIGG